MKTNIELKFAAVVGFLMILICLIVLSLQNKRSAELVDIKVYKHYVDAETNEGYYSECIITTEELSKINKELKRVDKLTDSTKMVGIIEGEYQVVSGDVTYAFDNATDKLIYRSTDNTMHTFNGSLYQIIIDRCES